MTQDPIRPSGTAVATAPVGRTRASGDGAAPRGGKSVQIIGRLDVEFEPEQLPRSSPRFAWTRRRGGVPPIPSRGGSHTSAGIECAPYR